MMGTSHMDAVLSVANLFMLLGANLFLQSSLLAGAGLFACRMLRNRGAALRSTILRLTLVAILVCPLVSFGLSAAGVARFVVGLPQATLVPREVPPHIHVAPRPGLPVPELTEVAREPITPMPVEPSVRHGASPASAPPEEPALVLPRTANSKTPGQLAGGYLVLTSLWLLGSGFFLFRLLIAHLRLARLRILASEAPADVRSACALLAQDLKVRPPRLLSCHLVKSPCLTGFLRPAILLPETNGVMDSQALRKVLVHELAHLAKRDCLWSLLSKLVHAVAFFQPLTWFLARHLEDVADEVADDFVVHHDTDRWSYARVLVDIAEMMQPALAEDLAGMGVVHFKSSLGWRLWRILDTTRELSTHITLRMTVLVTMLALCATLAAGFVGAGGKFRPDAWAQRRLQEALALRQEGWNTKGNSTLPPLYREEYYEAIEILDGLVEEYPDVDEYRGELGITVYHLIKTAVSAEERLVYRSQAAAILEPVSEAYATSAAARIYRHNLSRCYSLWQSDWAEEKLDMLRRAVEISRELVSVEPDNAEWQFYLATCLFRQGDHQLTLQQPDMDLLREALRHMQLALRLEIEKGMENGLDPVYRGSQGNIRAGARQGPAIWVDELVRQGRPDEARQVYEASLASLEELAREYPEFYMDVLQTLTEYHSLQTRIGRPAEAEQVGARTETLRQRIAVQHPDALQGWRYSHFSGPIVDFKVRINTPGEYQLFIRQDAHDADSNAVVVWIEELYDGPGGSIADFRINSCTEDHDFATRPWDDTACFESTMDNGLTGFADIWLVPSAGDYTIRFCDWQDGAALDAFVFQLSSLPAPQGDGPEESAITDDGVFLEQDGRITAEAEHFTSRTSHAGIEWLVVPEEDVGDTVHVNIRGKGYLQSLPDSSPTEEQAMALVLDWVETEPDNPEAWFSCALRHIWYGHTEEAISAYSKVIELDPKHWTAWCFRGDARARMRDYARAGEDQFRAGQLEFESDDVATPVWGTPVWAWWRAAGNQFKAGDIKAYRRTCEAMLEHYGDTKDAISANRVAWSCSLAPDAVVDPNRVVELARTALEGDVANCDYRITLGAALYRAGRYPEAVEELEDPRIQMSYGNASVMKDCFLAMALYRLGRTNDARERLAKAQQNMSDDLCDTLRLNEAKSLLNGTEVASTKS